MPDSPDVNLQLKKRARRRLVGAVAFAGLAAVVLPMVMDEEPKQQVQDVQIRIPGQDQAPFRPRLEAAGGETKESPVPSAEAARPAEKPAGAPARRGAVSTSIQPLAGWGCQCCSPWPGGTTITPVIQCILGCLRKLARSLETTVTSRVPRDRPRPKSRNRAAPSARITGTVASEMTLLTTVGFSQSPFSAVRGGLGRGMPRLPMIEETMALEAMANAQLSLSHDGKEAARAFMEKRAPQFRGY